MNTTRFYLSNQIGYLCFPQFCNILAIVNSIFHPIEWVAIEPTDHTLCKGFANLAICHFVLPHDPFVKFKNTLYHLSRNFSIISYPFFEILGPIFFSIWDVGTSLFVKLRISIPLITKPMFTKTKLHHKPWSRGS